MEEENIYTHIEDTMSNIYLNGNMLNSGTVMTMLKEKDKSIKELEEKIQGMVGDQIDLLAQANKQLALYKKALELASKFMEEKCDWNNNLLPVYAEKERIFDYFLQQAKDKINERN